MSDPGQADAHVVIAVTAQLVRALGPRNAIVMQQLIFWRAADVPCTRRMLTRVTGLTDKPVTDACRQLTELGLIVGDSPGGYDRTIEYEIDWETYAAICPNGQMDLPKRSNPFDQTGISTTTRDVLEIETRRDWQTRTDGVWVDARRLAEQLADEVAANADMKAKPVTRRSVEGIEKLIRLDGIAVDRVERCLNWIFHTPAGEFWRANIGSGQKLRAQFPTLQIQARRTTGIGSRDQKATGDIARTGAVAAAVDGADPWSPMGELTA